jgi:hypothetical protein
MALQKTITLPNTTSGNYIVLTEFAADYFARALSAHFYLFASAAAREAAPSASLGLLCKLRLAGDKFDEWLSTAALDALDTDTPDRLRHQIYQAAKSEPLSPGLGLRVDQLDLSDALDV